MTAIEKVVVVVFDGLRPDMISGRMPNLQKFAECGLSFSDARSVFPSVTRVATTSTASGNWPGRHGIVNNVFHMPEVLSGRALNTSSFDDLTHMDAKTDALVTSTTIGQQLSKHGKSLKVVHGGTAGAAYLINPTAGQGDQWTFSMQGKANTLTPQIVDRAIDEFGDLPKDGPPKFGAVDYLGRVMRHLALGDEQADVSLVWVPEPDTSYHFCQIGSQKTREVMRAADDMFANMVEHIRSGPNGDKTAIFVMSDHGQITTTKGVDLGAAMQADGFSVSHLPTPNTQLALTRGNVGELRILKGGENSIVSAADWLMQNDDIGMVFARDELVPSIEGALPMSLVHQFHDRTPELYYVMKSNDDLDLNGLPGQTVHSGGVPIGGGMHGGLNHYEMNTVLVMDVPGGRHNEVDTNPACLIDIAPTILSLLGFGHGADGRVLPVFEQDADLSEAEEFVGRKGRFAQRLVRKRLGPRAYLSHGGRVN